MGRKKLIGVIFFIGIVFSIAFFSEILMFITDYQWFKDLAYEQIFLLKITTQFKLGIPLFIISLVFYYLYLQLIKKNYYKKVQLYDTSISEKSLNRILLIPSVFLSYITSTAIAGSLWLDILTFINAQSFNISDPIFNKDVSFYMFKLPLFEKLLNTIIGILVAILFVTIIFHVILYIIRKPTMFENESMLRSNEMFFKNFADIGLKQIVVIVVIFFIILAIKNYFGAYSILYSTRGAVYGASYTDVKVGLLFYRLSMGVAGLGAIIIPIAYKKRKYKLALLAPISFVLIGILGGVVSTAVQSFVVDPNVLQRERPFIENNIRFTQKAYGLDNITIKDYDVNENLNIDDINNNNETIRNIRINDYRPTIESYNQLQAIRPYYRFLDVDIDRYTVNGKYTQVFLAPRELDINHVSENAKTWINYHLKYTHGYGVALSPVNQVTAQGQPELLIRNIPPVSTSDINVARPEVYFGELTNHYIVVNTKEKEFDYPLGEDNAETLYEGTAGVSLGGINRLLYALRHRSTKLFLSTSITSESRIVYHRNITERVRKIAPFLYYDEDPYIVIHEGRLFWIMDAYTIEGRYPYSKPYLSQNKNYIRNSVKVVVDAYNGDVDYYISDYRDPVVLTYKGVFPNLFKDLDQMPEGLRKHIRYPQDLFDIQAKVYELYHMNNPTVFYTEEDLWNIPQEKYYGAQQNVESQYMIFKLPGKEREEFVLSIPYTPNKLNNMTALLMARNDMENYGELILYRLPKDRNIYGPMQIEARIDQDPVISPQLTLWGEGGSTVIRGNLLVIPIENSILYVEPLYIKAANTNSPPEMRKVIVAFGDEIVMEDSLTLALNRIFGESTRIDESPRTDNELGEEFDIDTLASLITRANDAFEKANGASRQGNWAEYGRHINELERLLEQLKRLSE
ncbi:UPF0182 family protein [Serpentinicella alkaliphila]|uniref:UPF0182 protein EDD79_102621 n=1 Tax=Serpentinicella alkaliphila TaxID=1734049 RepID=A0A4R2TE04_9FIRM|nr:UPF0182 family protein [Serpentinicella alkaliphila]QUH25381.1 UPF0182 family protein [Serpentinicella alkaliphila]TCQ01558.1 hypothetical protein EDD79_102621 [Serpentinicella alkaliphila]